MTRGPRNWVHPEMWFEIRKNTAALCRVQILIGIARMVHENHRKQTSSRVTCLRSSVLPLLVVPITAAGLQGEQPLADRTM